MARLLSVLALLAAVGIAGCAKDSGREASPGVASGARATRLDSTRVPEDLRHLTPLAEEWGIGDDVERDEKVERSTLEQREALRTAVAPHHDRITAWLDSFGQGSLMSDEAAAFMYMQLAIEEMPE